MAKSGRKVGAPTIYSLEQIEKARKWFLEGKSLNQIARTLAEETGRHSTAPLILQWAERGRWKEQKAGIIEKTMTATVERVEQDREEYIQQQIDAYERMWEKGDKELHATNEEGISILRSHNVSEAADLVDKGIKGQQQLSTGMLHIRFVNAMADIFDEFLPDLEVRRRAIRKLREKLADYGLV